MASNCKSNCQWQHNALSNVYKHVLSALHCHIITMYQMPCVMAQLKSAAEAHNEQTPGTVQLFTHKMSIPESHLYCSGSFILCAPSADGEGAHIAHTTHCTYNTRLSTLRPCQHLHREPWQRKVGRLGASTFIYTGWKRGVKIRGILQQVKWKERWA